VTFRNHQALQPINIARADGLDFDVLGTLRPSFS
jgi:urea transport system substrate-binding protein